MDIPDKEIRSAENLRKVIMSSARDIRIIFIKLADRLHNMRTISSLREERRKRIATEAMEIYAPIAYKLGLHNIKSEMEDLAFEQLEPMVCRDIKERLNRSMRQRENDIEQIEIALKENLEKNNVKPVRIFGKYQSIFTAFTRR